MSKSLKRALALLIVIACLAGGALAGWLRIAHGDHGKSMQRPAEGAAGNTASGSRPAAAVMPVRRADLEDRLTLSAEFRPFQEVNLFARVAGYVREMRVDVGSRVKAGDVLAVLEIPDLRDDLQHAAAAVERANGEVARARAAYDEAHLTYTRMAQVVKEQPNLVAQQEIDQARARDEASHAAWQAAQSAVREAQAQRSKFATLTQYARIAAPFDGVVTRRLADTGSLVGAGTSSNGQAIVRLSQLDPLRLVLPVPESAVPRLRNDMPVEVLVQSTGQKIIGRVARASGEVATDTRTMHVEVDVPNRALTLAPGMYATAALVRDSRTNVLTVPIEAVPDRHDASAVVLVADKDDRLAERRITLGLETATQVEVKSGLDEGDRVVVGGRALRAGQLVEPKMLAEKAAR